MHRSALPPRLRWRARTPGIAVGRDYFEELGVESFINALAPYSRLGGNQMWPEVIEAMNFAMSHRARMKDLHDAVGKRIASLVGCEAAMVTAGAASAITLGTAACLTGLDEERNRRLPDVTGMKSEVIIQRGHHYSYNHAVRNCGVRLVEVETVDDVERAISDKTAMLYFVRVRESLGKIDAETFANLGKRHGVPSFIDTATRVPPAENLKKLSNLGFDLNCFSEGKGLKGPYSAGVLLGREDLIAAARRNAAPYDDTIGRGMKVSKEELLGMMVAVEVTLSHDLEAEKREKGAWLDELDEEIRLIPGIETERVLDRSARDADPMGRPGETHTRGRATPVSRGKSVDRNPARRRCLFSQHLVSRSRARPDCAPASRRSSEKRRLTKCLTP